VPPMTPAQAAPTKPPRPSQRLPSVQPSEPRIQAIADLSLADETTREAEGEKTDRTCRRAARVTTSDAGRRSSSGSQPIAPRERFARAP
jgi:hypothetical protein